VPIWYIRRVRDRGDDIMKVIGFVAVWTTFWALAGLAGIGY